ncbi:enoyl-CoA hydratase-related protein [Streptomyces sp. NPDC002520]
MNTNTTPVVRLSVAGPVAVIRLDDHTHRNRITPALRSGLAAALAAAEADTGVRAVVIEGSEEVFCAGAERAELMAGGWSPELDAFMRAPVRFPLPVVAAVRGNALGGGLLFALYADIVVVGETTKLSANFLDYGLTPCGGSTHLLPLRLGGVLGPEMLLSGRPYTGRELARRGCGLTVVGCDRVNDRARKAAERVARAPRDALIRFKRQLAGPLIADTDVALGRELDDHRATVSAPETQRRLTALYASGRTAV